MSLSINSSSQFSKILGSSTIVVADFYADWCGPCRAIAPTYESLAAKYSRPNKITFTKINVDNHQEISQRYGVRAMPTFLIFKSGSILQTVRGADKSALQTAIESAIKMMGPVGPVYSSGGRTLGSSNNQRAQVSKSINFKEISNVIISFIALYFTTLFSLDAFGAGENSPFNINKAHMRSNPSSMDKSNHTASRVGRKLGTIADL